VIELPDGLTIAFDTGRAEVFGTDRDDEAEIKETECGPAVRTYAEVGFKKSIVLRMNGLT
jgi:hypothetical protein